MKMRVLAVIVFVAAALAQADEADATPEAEAAFDLDSVIKESGEKFQFQAEVNRLMEIIIHSLYTSRNIFFRELISNAGDALDKIRYQSLLDPTVLGDNKELDIRLKIDKDAKTLSFRDYGVGMTQKELTENLGTVARSGTAKFLEAMGKKESEDESGTVELIGQFGVGFYSAFLVAEEVTVVSKSNDDDQYIWRSTADGNFVVVKDPRGNTLGRGTEVILKLKEDSEEFLEISEVENTVKKYSMFIQYPIQLWKSKTVTEEVPVESDDDEDDDEEGDEDDELTAEDEDDEPETKTVEKTVWDYERLNDNKPVWTRRPSEVEEQDYNDFYKAFEKSSDNPLAYTHFKAEGEIEFSSVLFIPKKAPFGLYDNYYTTDSELKLYVRRVLVADKWKEFIPRYLNFIRGLVDSNDLPLNVNREQLQKNKIMKVISKKVTRKALDMLRKLAEAEDSDDDDDEDEEGDDEGDEAEVYTKYQDFWKEFGKSIKLGIIEDSKNRKKLLNLLRFPTTASPDTPVSLQTYVDRMKDGQENIYFISAATLDEAKESPFLERVTKKGFEVVFFVDNLDEYMNLNEFDDYTLQAITKEGLDMGEGLAAKKYLEEKEEEFEDLTEWLKDVYGDAVTKVTLSERLEETPMIIVTTKYGYSANMERIARGQAFGSRSPTKASKILEVNFRHPVIGGLKDMIADDADKAKDLAQLLFDSALLQSGFIIEPDNIGVFASRVDRIVRNGLGVDADAEVEALPDFPDDEEEDDDDDDDEEEDYEDEDLDDEDDEKDEL